MTKTSMVKVYQVKEKFDTGYYKIYVDWTTLQDRSCEITNKAVQVGIIYHPDYRDKIVSYTYWRIGKKYYEFNEMMNKVLLVNWNEFLKYYDEVGQDAPTRSNM